MMSKISKVVKNEYVFSVIVKIIVIGIGFIQSIFLARFLGASLKGTSAYISSILSVCSIIFTFGMHQAYPYYKKKIGKENFFDNYMTIIYSVFCIYLLLSLIFYFMLKEIDLDVRCAVLLLPITYLANCFQYIYLIDAPNKRNLLYLIVTTLHFSLLLILYFFFSANYLWMVILLCFDNILKVIFYSLKLKFKVAFSRKTLKFFKEFVKFGFFPMLALLMTTLNYRIDVIMLKQYSSITNEMIGIYSLGISLSDKIVLLPDTLKGTLASKLANGKEDDEVSKVSRICFASTLLLSLLIIVFGQPVINILYGSEFHGAYGIVVITAVGAIFVSFFKLIAQYNIINKKQYLNVILLSLAIVTDVIGNLILIPIMGINGAAIATCLGNLICGIVFIIYFCRKTNTSPRRMFFLQKNDLDLLKSLFMHANKSK